MTNPIWDMKIGLKEFKRVLKQPKDHRFPLFLARALSRVPFYEVFHGFITPQQFKKHFGKIKPLIRTDPLGAGRLEFWEWLYPRI